MWICIKGRSINKVETSGVTGSDHFKATISTARTLTPLPFFSRLDFSLCCLYSQARFLRSQSKMVARHFGLM